jgi:small multidrug resistance pump
MTAAVTALVAAIFLGVVGQLLLKSGAGAPTFSAQLLSPQTIAGLSLFVFCALAYIYAIRTLPLSVALPSVSLSYVLVTFAAYWLYDEPLHATKLVGVALICLGVLLLGRTA